MAQNEAQQKLVAQAEKHRETLEEEFTLNLKRIREENQKTLDQTVRIREELIRSCQPVNNDGMLEKIEGNQGAEIVKYQLKLMKAQRDRLELELQKRRERHEADMLKVLEDNKNKERDGYPGGACSVLLVPKQYRYFLACILSEKQMLVIGYEGIGVKGVLKNTRVCYIGPNITGFITVFLTSVQKTVKFGVDPHRFW
jgi:hypothetical protein